MKFKNLAFILLLPLLACQNHNHGDHEATASVVLNNGQRWEANPETTQGIEQMQMLLNAFDPADTDPDHYQQLHAGLTARFQDIFKQCTMTGEAHEQLHHYLLPVNTLLGKMDNATIAENQETIHALVDQLNQYKTYFQ